jgi:hypothetical protein
MGGQMPAESNDSGPSRRVFLARFAGAAFAAPVIATFALDGVAQASERHDQHKPPRHCNPNQTNANQTQPAPPKHGYPNQTNPNQTQGSGHGHPKQCHPNQTAPNQTMSDG